MLCVHCTLCKIANYTFLSTYSDYFTDSLTITLNTSSYLLFSDYFSLFHFVYICVGTMADHIYRPARLRLCVTIGNDRKQFNTLEHRKTIAIIL